jgi:hypothetical protein
VSRVRTRPFIHSFLTSSGITVYGAVNPEGPSPTVADTVAGAGLDGVGSVGCRAQQPTEIASGTEQVQTHIKGLYRSAKPVFMGSTPIRCSNKINGLVCFFTSKITPR